MENYYKQRAEADIAQIRLDSKQEEKEQIYVKYFGGRKDIVKSDKNKPINKDKMAKYLVELDEKGIPEEIMRLKDEVKIRQHYLKKMEDLLSSLEDTEYEFLKLRYFEERKYTLEEIAEILDYSVDRIKQISAKVEKKINSLKSAK